MKKLKFIITGCSSRNMLNTIYDAIDERFDIKIKWLQISEHENISAKITIKGSDKSISGFKKAYASPYIEFLEE